MMAVMALIAMGLIGVAIYSLSQLNTTVWTSSLTDPVVDPTLQQNLPAFQYSVDGKTLTAQNFEGRWTLLSFWAHWCGPCLEELPALNQLSQQWQGPQFEVVTVNVDEAKSDEYEAAKRFLAEQDIALPTLFDKTGDLKKAFAVTDLPQHFLINPQAKIVWKARGAFKWNDSKTRDQLMKVMETEAVQEEATEGPTPESDPAPEPPAE